MSSFKSLTKCVFSRMEKQNLQTGRRQRPGLMGRCSCGTESRGQISWDHLIIWEVIHHGHPEMHTCNEGGKQAEERKPTTSSRYLREVHVIESIKCTLSPALVQLAFTWMTQRKKKQKVNKGFKERFRSGSRLGVFSRGCADTEQWPLSHPPEQPCTETKTSR